MNFKEISFPVYKVGHATPSKEGSRLFYEYEYGFDPENTFIVKRIVDDTSFPGRTLGQRRLQLGAAGEKLWKLHTPMYLLGELVKAAAGNTWFIDNTGKLFKYRKNTLIKIHCHKITRIIPAEGRLGCALEIEGIYHRMALPFVPSDVYNYVALGYYMKGVFIYDLLIDPMPKPLTRKV